MIFVVVVVFNTKTVAIECSIFSVVTPSLGCLTLIFFDRESF